jgi:alpha-1,2-glucosyltransferase
LVDYFKTAISFALWGLKNPFSVVASILPHIIILGAFGVFVLWNNGVVLGELLLQTIGVSESSN